MSSFFAKNLVGQGMFKILDKAMALEKSGKEIIHYEIGYPDFDTDYSIKDSLIKDVISNNTHYTSSKGHSTLLD